MTKPKSKETDLSKIFTEKMLSDIGVPLKQREPMDIVRGILKEEDIYCELRPFVFELGESGENTIRVGIPSPGKNSYVVTLMYELYDALDGKAVYAFLTDTRNDVMRTVKITWKMKDGSHER